MPFCRKQGHLADVESIEPAVSGSTRSAQHANPIAPLMTGAAHRAAGRRVDLAASIVNDRHRPEAVIRRVVVSAANPTRETSKTQLLLEGIVT